MYYNNILHWDEFFFNFIKISFVVNNFVYHQTLEVLFKASVIVIIYTFKADGET